MVSSQVNISILTLQLKARERWYKECEENILVLDSCSWNIFCTGLTDLLSQVLTWKFKTLSFTAHQIYTKKKKSTSALAL